VRVLTFRNVTKEYQLDADTVIKPVHNVSLNVEKGEFIVIVGRSGTGKTTLLNLAAGLVNPSSGTVTMENRDLVKMNDEELSSLRNQRMGFVFQFPSLLPALTIKDNVSLPAIFTKGFDGKLADKRAADLLCQLGLDQKLDVFPKQLSAGEQKRAVIARSLMNQPQLVLADEPTSDLDKRTEKEVLKILRDINSTGVTFLVVSHNVELVDFASRAFEMENGSLNLINKAPSSF